MKESSANKRSTSESSAKESSTSESSVTLDTLVSFCKRRGFVFPSAEIYGGLNGVYDIGHLGILLMDNLKKSWKQSVSSFSPDSVFFLDGALLGPQAVWDASGHTQNFNDPMVDVYGAGEPSLVVNGTTLYIYYSWISRDSVTAKPVHQTTHIVGGTHRISNDAAG